jgi:hypothetical protein
MVRELLAIGLFQTLIDTRGEDRLARRDGVLDELRALARAYPDDTFVRHQLTRSLYLIAIAPGGENGLARRRAVLYELRVLARAYPDDAFVRERRKTLRKSLRSWGNSA